MLLEKVGKLSLYSAQTLSMVSGPTMSVRKGPGGTGKSPEVVSELDVEHGIWTNKSLDEKNRMLPEKVRKLSLYSTQTLNIVSGPTNQCMKRSGC